MAGVVVNQIQIVVPKLLDDSSKGSVILGMDTAIVVIPPAPIEIATMFGGIRVFHDVGVLKLKCGGCKRYVVFKARSRQVKLLHLRIKVSPVIVAYRVEDLRRN